MAIKTLEFSSLNIPFKRAFKHASAERTETQTLWIELHGENSLVGYGESCPREYVTAETVLSAQRFIYAHRAEWLQVITDVQQLRTWVAVHHREIDENPSAWAAVELAFLDFFAKQQNQSVELLLGLPELAGSFQYTAVLGDAAADQFVAQLLQYQQWQFQAFKIKLSGDYATDSAKISALRAAAIDPQQVRADANNLWSDADVAIAYLQRLDFPFAALEEPLTANDVNGCRKINRALGVRIILDESLLRLNQLVELNFDPECWIVNLRIAKMGGILRSLELITAIQLMGVGLIIGAHVGESSLLTRAALTLAQCFRSKLLAQEGAFGTHLLVSDVLDESLMFGVAGILDTARYRFPQQSGWGLAINVNQQWKCNSVRI